MGERRPRRGVKRAKRGACERVKKRPKKEARGKKEARRLRRGAMRRVKSAGVIKERRGHTDNRERCTETRKEGHARGKRDARARGRLRRGVKPGGPLPARRDSPLLAREESVCS